MMNANQLNKKECILITGATSGIGYEMAFQLAEKMYPLILVARNEDNLKKMKLELYNRYRADVQWISKD